MLGFDLPVIAMGDVDESKSADENAELTGSETLSRLRPWLTLRLLWPWE